MNIALDAKVQCTDGAAGHVSRIILNPVADQITHIVVKTHNEEHEVDIAEIASADEHEVILNCSSQFVREQPDFIEVQYLRTPVEHYEVETSVYNAAGYYTQPYVTMETYTSKYENVPNDELTFTRGTLVYAEDERIGKIDEMVVDPTNYHITHIVLREGHLWGRKDIVIPVEHVKHIDAEGVHLNLMKTQVEALPTIPLKRYFGRQVEN